jgi:hypothetical protein
MRVSMSPEFVNRAFQFAVDVLPLPGMPNADVEGVLLAAMQGRLAIMRRAPPYNYDDERFAFFPFLREYVARFPDRAAWIAAAVPRWLPRVSGTIVPTVVEVLSACLAGQLISENDARGLLRDLLGRPDDGDSSAVRVTVEFACSLRRIFPTDSAHFLAFIERRWAAHAGDRAAAAALASAVIEVFAEPGFAAERDFPVFTEIADAIVAGALAEHLADFARSLVAMCDRAVPCANRDRECGRIFAKILTRGTQANAAAGFQGTLLRDMHRCLKGIARSNAEALTAIEADVAENSVASYRLRQLLKAFRLPEF